MGGHERQSAEDYRDDYTEPQLRERLDPAERAERELGRGRTTVLQAIGRQRES